MAVKKPNYDEIFDSVTSVLVPHADYATGARRIRQVYRRMKNAEEAVCIALLGESRTGKTRLIKELAREYPPVRHAEYLEVPVLRVTTPSRPTVMGLQESMLQALGDPRFNIGTQCAKLTRLIKLLRAAKTRVVVADEFQHFVDKRSATVSHDAADTLKIIVDEARVGLITAGLARSERVIRENEQLDGRFLAPIRLSRFDWNNKAQRKQFVGILVAFHRSISRYVDMPDFGNQEMGFRIYVGCGGLIGYVVKFLEQLVWNVGENRKNSVTLADLRRAYSDSVAKDKDVGCHLQPFHKQFLVDPENKSVLNLAKQVGQEQLPKTDTSKKGGKRKSTSRSKKKPGMSMNDALRAA